jgi:hypothetical protein
MVLQLRLQFGLRVMLGIGTLFCSPTAARAACNASNPISVRVVQLCGLWPSGSRTCHDGRNEQYDLDTVKEALRRASGFLPICLDSDRATFSIKPWKWSSDPKLRFFDYGSGFSLPASLMKGTDLGILLQEPEFLPRSWRQLDIVIIPGNRMSGATVGERPRCTTEGTPIAFGDSGPSCLEGNSIVIRQGSLETETLAHEIGHWLGVGHPFVLKCEQETLPDTVNDRSAEGRNRQFGSCDAQKAILSFRMLIGDTDACGKPIDDLLKRQLANIMEYTKGCPNPTFTDDQLGRMIVMWNRRRSMNP